MQQLSTLSRSITPLSFKVVFKILILLSWLPKLQLRIWTKIDLKTEILSVFESSHFVNSKRSLCNTGFVLPICVSIYLLCLLSRANCMPPSYLNFSTFCTVLQLTWAIHWLGLLEKHNSLFVSVLHVSFYIDLTQLQTDQERVEHPVQTMQVLNCPQRANGWSCIFLPWHPCWLACDWLIQGWSTSRRRRATFLTVLSQRATSYTWAHTNITPSLSYTHTFAQL